MGPELKFSSKFQSFHGFNFLVPFFNQLVLPGPIVDFCANEGVVSFQPSLFFVEDLLLLQVVLQIFDNHFGPMLPMDMLEVSNPSLDLSPQADKCLPGVNGLLEAGFVVRVADDGVAESLNLAGPNVHFPLHHYSVELHPCNKEFESHESGPLGSARLLV